MYTYHPNAASELCIGTIKWKAFNRLHLPASALAKSLLCEIAAVKYRNIRNKCVGCVGIFYQNIHRFFFSTEIKMKTKNIKLNFMDFALLLFEIFKYYGCIHPCVGMLEMVRNVNRSIHDVLCWNGYGRSMCMKAKWCYVEWEPFYCCLNMWPTKKWLFSSHTYHQA